MKVEYLLKFTWISGGIDDHMSNLIIAQLLYLESEDPEAQVSPLLEASLRESCSALATIGRFTLVFSRTK